MLEQPKRESARIRRFCEGPELLRSSFNSVYFEPNTGLHSEEVIYFSRGLDYSLELAHDAENLGSHAVELQDNCGLVWIRGQQGVCKAPADAVRPVQSV